MEVSGYTLHEGQLGTAIISNDQAYRYHLSRRISDGDRTVTFLMLNPSTAHHDANDRTLEACINQAKAKHYDRLDVVNLFAYRSTDKKQLRYVDDPIGPHNDQVIRFVTAKADCIVAAWGNHQLVRERALRVLEMLPNRPRHALKILATGEPRHPLYWSPRHPWVDLTTYPGIPQ